jgi:hypothetical protein
MIFPCFRRTGLSGIGEDVVEETETLANRRVVCTGVNPVWNLTFSPIIYNFITKLIVLNEEIKLKFLSLPPRIPLGRIQLQN